jgi:hypothetical protein
MGVATEVEEKTRGFAIMECNERLNFKKGTD